jgi:hypothetical protein
MEQGPILILFYHADPDFPGSNLPWASRGSEIPSGSGSTARRSRAWATPTTVMIPIITVTFDTKRSATCLRTMHKFTVTVDSYCPCQGRGLTSALGAAQGLQWWHRGLTACRGLRVRVCPSPAVGRPTAGQAEGVSAALTGDHDGTGRGLHRQGRAHSASGWVLPCVMGCPTCTVDSDQGRLPGHSGQGPRCEVLTAMLM